MSNPPTAPKPWRWRCDACGFTKTITGPGLEFTPCPTCRAINWIFWEVGDAANPGRLSCSIAAISITVTKTGRADG